MKEQYPQDSSKISEIKEKKTADITVLPIILSIIEDDSVAAEDVTIGVEDVCFEVGLLEG